MCPKIYVPKSALEFAAKNASASIAVGKDYLSNKVY
jgi:hypothetical protein